MSCRKWERRISDSMDGKLSEKASRGLEVHLAECPPCRAYRARVERIQRGTAVRERPFVPDGYWDDFSARLRARLESPGGGGRPPVLERQGRRWAWLGAAAAAAGVLIFFQVFRPVPSSIMEPWSYEERLDTAGQAALEGGELAGELDESVLASIQEDTGVLSSDELPPLADDPVFWDSLTDDEAAVIDREIAEELKS
jgi:anti-sigma factor RsiW